MRRPAALFALVMLAALSVVAIGCGTWSALAQGSPWDEAFDQASGTRFIPIELWTGGAWDGNRDLVAAPALLAFGKRGEKSITGPIEWTRPGTGEKLLVYRRINRDKEQLFTITSRRDGLGRVYDSRYDRNCIDEVKFPLGLWRRDEARHFTVVCGGLARPLKVTIEEIDYVYQGVAHSLKFHWLVDDGKGKGTDMRYIYSPGKGLVAEWGNE